MEDRVIHDVMGVLGRPQGAYPESFVSLFLYLADIQGCLTKMQQTDRQTDKQTYTRGI